MHSRASTPNSSQTRMVCRALAMRRGQLTPLSDREFIFKSDVDSRRKRGVYRSSLDTAA